MIKRVLGSAAPLGLPFYSCACRLSGFPYTFPLSDVFISLLFWPVLTPPLGFLASPSFKGDLPRYRGKGAKPRGAALARLHSVFEMEMNREIGSDQINRPTAKEGSARRGHVHGVASPGVGRGGAASVAACQCLIKHDIPSHTAPPPAILPH